MINIKEVRENYNSVKKNIALRGPKSLAAIERLKKEDEKWRASKLELDELRFERNKISHEINGLKKSGKKAEIEIAKAKQISDKIQKLEQRQRHEYETFRDAWLSTPNILDKSVPKGEDERANKLLRKYGTVNKKKIIPHYELAEKNEWVDIERAAKVAGSRFYYLKGDLARLEYALMLFALDILRGKGYTMISPPDMINKASYQGVTLLSDFEDVIYKIDKEDLYLIATSEHSIAPIFKDEIISLKSPERFVAVSPCFRKEAGSHGQDTKGIFRVHQFYKVEQFIFSRQQDSEKLHEELIKNSEEIFKKLKLPYRLMLLSSGDTTKTSSKTVDLEVYIPSQERYREEGSMSNCRDYQARRLNIKYDEAGEKQLCHTLNGTAIATPRTLIAIIENYQEKDGSVRVPSVLVKYMGGQKKLMPVSKGDSKGIKDAHKMKVSRKRMAKKNKNKK